MAAQDYEQLTYGSPDGAQLGGASTDKVGFWGATPVVRQSGSGAITLTTVTATSPYGFATATAASAFVQEMKAISDALRTLGIIG